MGMVQQILSPGVEDREEADPPAQVLRRGGDLEKRLADGAEQQAVDQPRILQCERRQEIGGA
jgi:hypothetical protein